MRYHLNHEFIAFGVLVVVISTLVLFLRYTGMRAGHAALAWLATIVTAGLTTAYRYNQFERISRDSEDAMVTESFFFGLLILFGTAFCIRLYRKWLDQALTDDERAGGARGLRAWLSPGNLIVAGIVSVSAWQGMHWSLVLMLALTIGLLVMWPVLHAQPAPIASPSTGIAAASARPAAGSSEREKVLALLEAGKISAEESAELLHALGPIGVPDLHAKSQAVRMRGIVLAGAVLVLIGFFLPWFSFTPGDKLSEAMSAFGMGEPGLEQMTHQMMPHTTVTVRGGDVNNGLGWLVLVLGVSGALLPILAPQMDPSVQRTARLIAVGAGGVVALYIVSQDLRSASLGIVLVLAGYVCQAIGLWQDERPAHRVSQLAADA